jgi:hypothetical protein
MKNILYFDFDSHDFKSEHARYEEGMNNGADPPPNARLVRFAQQDEAFPAKAVLLEALDLDVSLCPCPSLVRIPPLDLQSPSALIASVYTFAKFSRELQPLATVKAVVSSSASTLCRCRVALSRKPCSHTTFDASIGGLPPSNSFSLPKFAPMLSTFVATRAPSVISAQVNPRSSYRFGGGGFCGCVCYCRCA